MTEKEKKEKVLHARIPASLEAEIKKRADVLRIPVSNLIRNCLEDAFDLVEHVSANVDTMVNQVAHDANRVAASAKAGAAQVRDRLHEAVKVPDPEAFTGSAPAAAAAGAGGAVAATPLPTAEARARVFAWQAVTANVHTVCADCGTAIAPGDPCQFGLTGQPADRVFVCQNCGTTGT